MRAVRIYFFSKKRERAEVRKKKRRAEVRKKEGRVKSGHRKRNPTGKRKKTSQFPGKIKRSSATASQIQPGKREKQVKIQVKSGESVPPQAKSSHHDPNPPITSQIQPGKKEKQVKFHVKLSESVPL